MSPVRYIEDLDISMSQKKQLRKQLNDYKASLSWWEWAYYNQSEKYRNAGIKVAIVGGRNNPTPPQQPATPPVELPKLPTPPFQPPVVPPPFNPDPDPIDQTEGQFIDQTGDEVGTIGGGVVRRGNSIKDLSRVQEYDQNNSAANLEDWDEFFGIGDAETIVGDIVDWFGGNNRDWFDSGYNSIYSFFAGWGSGLTFGATDYLRGGLYGDMATRNHNGILYYGGWALGTVHQYFITGGATAGQTIAGRTLPEILKPVFGADNNIIRADNSTRVKSVFTYAKRFIIQDTTSYAKLGSKHNYAGRIIKSLEQYIGKWEQHHTFIPRKYATGAKSWYKITSDAGKGLKRITDGGWNSLTVALQN